MRRSGYGSSPAPCVLHDAWVACRKPSVTRYGLRGAASLSSEEFLDRAGKRPERILVRPGDGRVHAARDQSRPPHPQGQACPVDSFPLPVGSPGGQTRLRRSQAGQHTFEPPCSLLDQCLDGAWQVMKRITHLHLHLSSLPLNVFVRPVAGVQPPRTLDREAGREAAAPLISARSKIRTTILPPREGPRGHQPPSVFGLKPRGTELH